MKLITRERLEDATIKMLKEHGFSAMTVDQIAKAANTTRTTFYQYFTGKSDLIPFIQSKYIAPEMIAICLKLDALDNPTWQDVRKWLTDYAETWARVHIFFYAETASTDPAIARSIMPNSSEVTAHMTQLLGRFQGEERGRIHVKLNILLAMTASVLISVHVDADPPATSPLLDRVTDIWWDALFTSLPTKKS